MKSNHQLSPYGWPSDPKSDHRRFVHGVGAILVIAHRKAALSRAKTSFAPTCCLGQCPNVVWFDLVHTY